MTGIPLLIVFVIAVILMIVAIAKWKIHPFLSIMGVSLILAIAAGLDITKLADDVIGAGFSGTFKSIGIVIILGALVGTLLEKTGAALKMADVVVKLVGKKNPETAMMIMGWIVSIPVFCDSGFVILNPIRKALVKRTGKSSVACTVALSLGLYISHCFIPPTPGPIAAANTLYQGLSDAAVAAGGVAVETNLLLVMGIGALCSILPIIAGILFAIIIGKKVKDRSETAVDNGEVVQSYEELVASYGKLPGAFMSFAPIVLPIILMGLASAFDMAGTTPAIITFLGKPIIALTAGLIVGVILLAQCGMMKDFYAMTNDTLKTVGPILFVTAAGGVLGKVISSTSLVQFISDNANVLQSLGLIFPFLLAAILKSAQGSSTVAITTTAGILAPLMMTLGFVTPLDAALVVIAIGAGAMCVSHANDSYFWVVTNFGDMEPQQGYKTQTLGTLVIAIAAMINVLLVSVIF